MDLWYQANEITEKVYKYIMNSMQILYKMDTTFTDSKNDKASEPHR